jgi:two-component system, NarL family, nitrate/nitrite response regulator NarL
MPDRGNEVMDLLKLAVKLTHLGPFDPNELGRAKAAWDYDLTRHEIHLLELIARGMDNNQIAEKTGVAEENTIKKQISAVFRKLGVHNRVEAAMIPHFYGFGPTPLSLSARKGNRVGPAE